MRLLRDLWSKAKTYAVLILSGLIGVLYIAVRIVSGQKQAAQHRADQAERKAENAEARIVQRQKAEAANQQAKVTGEENVEKAVERARSGDRRHFE